MITLLKDPNSTYQRHYDTMFGKALECNVFFSQRLNYESIGNNGIV